MYANIRETNSKVVNYADKDGQFRRQDSVFRGTISADPSSPFPAEAGRYVLYVHIGCPWAHRTLITRRLKGLESIVQLVELDGRDPEKGMMFTGASGYEKDPIYGYKYLRELYLKANPEYAKSFTVPVLWDKKKGKMFHQFELPTNGKGRNGRQQREQRDYSYVLRSIR
jgi:putative glutathione S-transferase